MTWLKLGEEFSLECALAELSDAAFRTHAEGLSYAMSRENDGVFLEREVKRFAESARATEAVQELINAGFWAKLSGGRLKIVHHMSEQLSAAYLQDKRKTNAARQQRKREIDNLVAQGYSKAQAEDIVKGRTSKGGNTVTPPVTRDVTAPVTSNTTRDPERSGEEQNRTAFTKESEGFSEKKPRKLPVRSFPDCSNAGCDGRLNQQSLDAGLTICADCAWRERQVS